MIYRFDICWFTWFFIGENEDAINQAREAFHAHLSNVKRSQVQPDYTDEELLMEERDIEQDYAGRWQKMLYESTRKSEIKKPILNLRFLILEKNWVFHKKTFK